MCWSCSCAIPDNGHDDVRNLTTLTLQGAADAQGIDVPAVVANIARTLAGSAPFSAHTALKEAEPVVEGTVLKADDENRFLLLVSYSANTMPARGADGYIDVANPAVLEKACWRFMDNGAKAGLWHQEGHADSARVVENYIYRNPIPWVIKAPNGRQQVVKAGDWLTGLILEPDTWRLYKAGRIGGASPQGRAGRRAAAPETLARMRSDA